jgi:hypothetical protein
MDNKTNEQPLVSPSGEDEINVVHVNDVKEAAKRLSFSQTLDVGEKSTCDNDVIIAKTGNNQTKQTISETNKKGDNLVDVFLRLRPKLGSKPEDETLVPATDVDVVATAPTNSHSYKMGERETKFTFSGVFPTSTTQEQLFTSVTQPLVDTLLSGGQGLLFAYGMTNAGKTYTIQGSEHNPGVLPRSLDKIFKALEEKCGSHCNNNIGENKNNNDGSNDGAKTTNGFKVNISYLEIYNEKIYDLLQPAPKNAWERRKILSLKEIRGRVVVKGLKHVQVQNSREALNLAQEGLQNRAVAETALNSDSSRSHSVFTISIFGFPGQKKPGKLSIVDLAGSERSDRTKSSGIRVREAGKINSSLMHLIHCIRQLRWNQTHSKSQNRIVPFRETRLTRLFQESFAGNVSGNIAMVVNCSTEAEDFDETLHVLKNASIARSVSVSQKESRVNSWRSLASLTKYGLDGRRRKRRAEESTDALRAKTINGRVNNEKKMVGGKAQRKSKKSMASKGNRPVPMPIQEEEGEEKPAQKHLPAPVIVQGVAPEVVEQLKMQISELQDELASIETEVRIEMAQDFQDRLEKTEEEYKSRYEDQLRNTEAKWKRKLSLARLSDVGRGRDSTGSNISSTSKADEIECLDNQIAECEEEMDRMRETHAMEIKSLNDNHSSVIQQYEEKIRNLESNMHQKSSSIASDKIEKQNILKQLKLATDDVQQKNDDIKALKNQHKKSLDDHNLKFEEMKTSLNNIVDEKNKEIESLTLLQNEEVASIRTKYDTIVSNFEKSKETLQISFEKLTNEKIKVDALVQQCKDTNATLMKRIEDVEEIKLKQETELNDLKHILKQKTNASKDDAANLNLKYQLLKKEMETVKTEHIEAIEKIRILKNSQEEEINTFTQGMVDMENENTELQKTAMKYAEKIKEMQESIKIKNQEMETYKLTNIQTEKDNENKIVDLQRKLESVTNQKNAIEKNHSKHLDHETKDLKRQVEDQGIAIQELQTELVDENHKSVEMEEMYSIKISKLEEKINISKTENKDLKRKLKDSKNKIEHLHTRMKELTDLKNFNDKQQNDVENSSTSSGQSSKKRNIKRKKLSDINPGTVINVQTDRDNNIHSNSKKIIKGDDELVQSTGTPGKVKKQKSSAKKFARTIKGSFRGFTSLMSRTGKTPKKAGGKLSSTPEESSIASRTRGRRFKKEPR